MNGKCGYSHPGTWGHECGKPAVFAQFRKTDSDAGKSLVDGIYCHARCAECIKYDGPDNQGLKRDKWEPYNPEVHVNRWIKNNWPNPPTIKVTPA